MYSVFASRLPKFPHHFLLMIDLQAPMYTYTGLAIHLLLLESLIIIHCCADSPWGGSGDSPPPRLLRRSSPVVSKRLISPDGHPGLGRSHSSEPPDRMGRVNQLRRSVSEGRNDEQEYIGKNELKISGNSAHIVTLDGS